MKKLTLCVALPAIALGISCKKDPKGKPAVAGSPIAGAAGAAGGANGNVTMKGQIPADVLAKMNTAAKPEFKGVGGRKQKPGQKGIPPQRAERAKHKGAHVVAIPRSAAKQGPPKQHAAAAGKPPGAGKGITTKIATRPASKKAAAPGKPNGKQQGKQPAVGPLQRIGKAEKPIRVPIRKDGTFQLIAPPDDYILVFVDEYDEWLGVLSYPTAAKDPKPGIFLPYSQRPNPKTIINNTWIVDFGTINVNVDTWTFITAPQYNPLIYIDSDGDGQDDYLDLDDDGDDLVDVDD